MPGQRQADRPEHSPFTGPQRAGRIFQFGVDALKCRFGTLIHQRKCDDRAGDDCRIRGKDQLQVEAVGKKASKRTLLANQQQQQKLYVHNVYMYVYFNIEDTDSKAKKLIGIEMANTCKTYEQIVELTKCS